MQEWDRWDEAEDHFKKAIGMDPNYLEARENMAQLYVTQGKIQAGKKLYETISLKKHDDPR